jgi:hypothetical protein
VAASTSPDAVAAPTPSLPNTDTVAPTDAGPGPTGNALITLVHTNVSSDWSALASRPTACSAIQNRTGWIVSTKISITVSVTRWRA